MMGRPMDPKASTPLRVALSPAARVAVFKECQAHDVATAEYLGVVVSALTPEARLELYLQHQARAAQDKLKAAKRRAS